MIIPSPPRNTSFTLLNSAASTTCFGLRSAAKPRPQPPSVRGQSPSSLSYLGLGMTAVPLPSPGGGVAGAAAAGPPLTSLSLSYQGNTGIASLPLLPCLRFSHRASLSLLSDV